MKKNQILCFIFAAFLIASLTAGVGTAAGLDDEKAVRLAIDDNPCGPGGSFRNDALKRYDRFFDRLVSEGIISADQKSVIKSAIEAAVKEAHSNGGWKIDMSTVLASLVREGVLTEVQKAAIETAIRAERLEAAMCRVKNVLDDLVNAGTITEAQEKAILSAVADAVDSAGGRPDLDALLLSLSKYGVINDGQRAAIEKALKPAHHVKWHLKLKEDTQTTKPAL